MRLLCEVIAFDILPAARALIAKRLTDTYGFSQKEAAEAMGLTQPAVSQYKSNARGHKIEAFTGSPEAMMAMDELAKRISHGIPIEEMGDELYRLCERVALSVSGGKAQKAGPQTR